MQTCLPSLLSSIRSPLFSTYTGEGGDDALVLGHQPDVAGVGVLVLIVEDVRLQLLERVRHHARLVGALVEAEALEELFLF